LLLFLLVLLSPGLNAAPASSTLLDADLGLHFRKRLHLVSVKNPLLPRLLALLVY
jgi:hypothetical protein